MIASVFKSMILQKNHTSLKIKGLPVLYYMPIYFLFNQQLFHPPLAKAIQFSWRNPLPKQAGHNIDKAG